MATTGAGYGRTEEEMMVRTTRTPNRPIVGGEDETKMCSATNRQVGYAVLLLRQAGYSIERMDSATFGELGATMRERSGRVENWLKGMSAAKASRLIQRLKWECRLNARLQRSLKEHEQLSTMTNPSALRREIIAEARRSK